MPRSCGHVTTPFRDALTPWQLKKLEQRVEALEADILRIQNKVCVNRVPVLHP